jgi:hypothetical protein
VYHANTENNYLKTRHAQPSNLKSHCNVPPRIHLFYSFVVIYTSCNLKQPNLPVTNGRGRGRRGKGSALSPCACLGPVLSIVVILVDWLEQFLRNLVCQALGQDVLASNDWSHDQCEEDNQQDEVQDSVSPDASLSELRLFHRIDWWSNLPASYEVS